ncbi:hypothetical protein ACSNOI_10225 [Actinomadura kijaniata]|uniref:hypothetical protein n=1 Tax=Actinomadura kijaniata TaxID=46161 RepID=UPI003F1BB01E
MAVTTQHNIDTWHVERRDPTRPHAFLHWAMASGHMPRLYLLAKRRNDRPPLSQDRRLTLLRRLLTDPTIALRTRIAACLVLLYAQPVSRLVRLTVHDILQRDGQAALRLGATRPLRSPSRSLRCSSSWPPTAPT